MFGSRFLSGQPHRVLYFWHSVGNRFLTTASNMFTNLNLTDMETCYKAFRREVIQSIEIEEDRFGFEPEITAKVAAARLARLRGRHLATPAAPTPRARRSAGRTASRAMYGDRPVLGRVARRARDHLDRVPDRSIPPAEFDDADPELSDVLRVARGGRQLRRLDLQPRSSRTSATTCSRSAPATASSPSGCAADATRDRDRPLDALRRRARDRASPARRTSTCCQVDIAATRRGRPPLRLGRAHQRARAHRRRRRARSRRCARSLKPGGRLCVFVPAFDGLYSDFDRGSGTAAATGGRSSSTAFDRAGFDIIDARYVNTVGALAWWVLARQLGQVPTQRWSVSGLRPAGGPDAAPARGGPRTALRPVAVLRGHRSRLIRRAPEPPPGRPRRAVYGNDWPTSRRCLSCALA